MNESEQQLISRYSLVDVLQSSDVNLIREGQVFVGDCPFHDDNNAALMIEPSTQHWQCDGACQTGGSLVEWLMKSHSLEREQALEWIQTGQGINCSPQDNDNAILSSTQEEQDLNQHLIDYYHQTIKGHPQALAYLKQRKIDHPEVLAQFQLGFSDRSLGSHLPQKNRKEGAAIRGKLMLMGWLKPSGHELMRGSLVVPVINDGLLLQAYGRKITSNLRSGTPDHVYLHEAHRGVFNLDALKVSDEWIICQSLIDALTFWCAGYRNITTSFQLGALPEAILQAVNQYQPKRLLIAFEVSEEAEQAVTSVSQQLEALNVESYRIELPQGMDVNDVAVKHKDHQTQLGGLIRKAVWLKTGCKDETPIEADSSIGNDTEINELAVEQQVSEMDETVIPESETELGIEDEPLYDDGLPATVAPPTPSVVDKTCNEIELSYNFENRKYRVRGLENNNVYDKLRINLLVSIDELLHVDTFDVYSTKHRQAFIKLTALELGVDESIIKKDISTLLLQLEIEQQNLISNEQKSKVTTKTLSDQEHTQAMEVLQSPKLIEHIVEDLTKSGLVGEDNNKLLAYLVSLSRKLAKPLAVIIQSTSAAGKSALMNHVLSFVPIEDRVQYSALTGQSLFYMSDLNLKHKILAVSENEGVSQAAYALRVLQSEGCLSIATTGKDPLTGKHTTHEYQVEGPVTIFSTTTAVDIDEELLNRCLVIQVNEQAEQTKAIHAWKRFEETLEGMQLLSQKQAIIAKHQNMQRLIKPLLVVNPYAEQLTFTNSKTRTRRDQPKYLTLIKTIALLHQHQREIKTTFIGDKQVFYIEVTLADIELANKLVGELLGHSLVDLPPQTRKLLMQLDEMVNDTCQSKQLKRQKVRFTRRDIYEYTGLGMTQLHVHLHRLEAMEYVLRHKGKNGQKMVYELLYQSQDLSDSEATGLINLDTLQQIIPMEKENEFGTLSATFRDRSTREIQTTATNLSEVFDLSGLSEKHAGVITQHHSHTVNQAGGRL